MDKNTVPVPKIFISYSWTTPEHEAWVLELAERLYDDGIEVVFDKWDLKEGQDIFAFMESMVSSPDINKVLVICDKGYKDKADKRTGGVGTETQIITSEVYSKTSQEKFIPIIAERDSDGTDFIPIYMQTRKYIDLSSDQLFVQNYESLLRNLFNRPQYRKPKLGSPPSYLFQDERINSSQFDFLIKQIEKNIGINDWKVKSFMNDYAEKFISAMDEFEIDKIEDINNADDLIMSKIDDMLILRDNFVIFLEKLAYNVSSDYLIDFFTNLYNHYVETKKRTSQTFYVIQWDHYLFFFRELFLYLVMILLRTQQFELLGEVLKGTYFVNEYNEITSRGFDLFDCYLDSLEQIKNKKYEQNTRQRKLSMLSEVLINRANIKSYTKEKIVEADYLLYYVSCLREDIEHKWYPRSYVYQSYTKIDLFYKLKSKRYLSKYIYIFGFENKDDFIAAVRQMEYPYREGHFGTFAIVHPLSFHIAPDEIGTLP